ncbi:MAG: efflux RND transporter permease subunit [Symbiopectobacterium sp.]
MTRLDNLIYISSQSSSRQTRITLTLMRVSIRSIRITPAADAEAVAIRDAKIAARCATIRGFTVNKTGDTNILMIAFISTDGSMQKQDTPDYVANNVQEPLRRINGVGSVDIFGLQYVMRI